MTKVGVVDIGSNSVRLVIYDDLKRVPLPLFNEKVLCGLARDMENTGKLYPEGVKRAEGALGRFAHIIKAMDVTTVHAFATAAVRDATDGPAFKQKFEEQYGFSIRVLSGEEEAELAAFGVASAMHGVRGVIGDFGGGSLELVSMKYDPDESRSPRDSVRQNISFPIGAYRLSSIAGGDPSKAQAIVDEDLMQFKLKKLLKDKRFYAVGGGFRALAKVHMLAKNYPVRVLHHYAVEPKVLLSTLETIMNASPEVLSKMRGVSASRVDTLPYAALVMQRIIALGKPKEIVFSTHGVREGVLFDQLDEESCCEDPLIAACGDMIRHITPDISDDWVQFGHELYDWMTPLFRNETEEIHRLRFVACILSRLAWYEHTAYRAEMAFRWVVDAAIPAVDHQARVFIASSVFHRYETDPEPSVLKEPQSLLERKMIFRAHVVGVAMRLGYAVSGGALGVLEHTNLSLTQKNTLILRAQDPHKILLQGDVQRRLERLGEIAGLKVVIK